MLDLEPEYEINSTEVGKLVIVFSLAFLIFSVHGFYVMESTEKDIIQSERQLEGSLDYLESRETQRLTEAMQDIRGLSEEFFVLEQNFQNAEQSLNATRSAKNSVTETREQYQWMVVFSISLMIAGITLVLIEVG